VAWLLARGLDRREEERRAAANDDEEAIARSDRQAVVA
jgi:hypothetical protein